MGRYAVVGNTTEPYMVLTSSNSPLEAQRRAHRMATNTGANVYVLDRCLNILLFYCPQSECWRNFENLGTPISILSNRSLDHKVDWRKVGF
jgi:hypothetical protein